MYIWISLTCMSLVTQSCLTLCDLMNYKPTRLLCPSGFSRQEYWSRLPCSPPRDLPNPGIEPRSPILQVNSLPSETPGKPLTSISSQSQKFILDMGNRKLFFQCQIYVNIAVPPSILIYHVLNMPYVTLRLPWWLSW